MGGINFLTSGDGTTHLLTEKLGGEPASPMAYRVVIRNEAFNLLGTSVVTNSGPLAVGIDGVLSAVLVKPQATAIDSITLHNVYLTRVCWNDFTKSCQMSVTWNEEPPSGSKAFTQD